MNIIVNNDTPQFQTWFAGVQSLVANHFATEFPTLIPDVMTVSFGGRYVKVTAEKWQTVGGERKRIQDMVWAFVDRTNGDVLKPASWRAPAKHARENIFSDTNGLKGLTPYGPPYLRG